MTHYKFVILINLSYNVCIVLNCSARQPKIIKLFSEHFSLKYTAI